MNQLRLAFTVSLLLFIITNSCSQKKDSGKKPVFGSFVASTPCTGGTKPLPGIPVSADCELIKWNLTLYSDHSNKAPGTYRLHCVYGLPKQGTTGLIDGGKQLELEGNWTIVKGMASNPNAEVYRLIDKRTNKTISFLKLNDNLLHLLDSAQHLMIGNPGWSYTLNRVKNK